MNVQYSEQLMIFLQQVLEFCQMQWKTDVFMNITETKPTIYPPVLVDVYFESLCPDSEKFIKEQLFPTYEKFAGKNILNISLVPYGNAEVKFYTFSNIVLFAMELLHAHATQRLLSTYLENS